MSIEITDLTTLDPDLVASVQANLQQLLQEANPTLDLKRGVLHDLLLYYSAILTAKNQTELARYQSANSLAAILADPTLADDGVVDAVFSNYMITRGAGATAVGELAIVLSAPVSVTIGSGAVFTANGNVYTANSAFTAKAEPEQINNTSDRLLTELSDGTWVFTIDVTAAVAGSAGLLPKDTLLVPAALPTAYVTSYAASDFTGGLDPETNSDMVSRLQQGIAAQVPSNRVNMQAMLRAQANFASVVATSVIGHGDVEMLRADHTIFPVRMGGYVDWYVRSQEQTANITLSKTAVLAGFNSDGSGRWQVTILRDDAPGFYEIVSIQPPASANTAGTLELLSDVRGLDLSAGGTVAFVPDVQLVTEGAYSRFQTAVVQFSDPATVAGTAAGTAAAYMITLSMLPQIDQVQDFMSGRDVRSVGSDLLVKAPIPCFVKLTVAIAKKNTQADPDTAAIAAALAHAVNTTDFVGRLYAGSLQDVVAGYLAQDMSPGAINMLGRIRCPDGTVKFIYDENVLVVPVMADPSVSANTVQFFLSPADVTINVAADVPVPV